MVGMCVADEDPPSAGLMKAAETGYMSARRKKFFRSARILDVWA